MSDNFLDLIFLSNSFFIKSMILLFEFNCNILFCTGTCCHIAFIIFSICGSTQLAHVLSAQRLSHNLSFNTTSSIFSSQIVVLTKSKSDFRSFCFFFSSFFSFSVFSSSSMSSEVIETRFASLYSVNHCTKNESIGSVNTSTSILFFLNCAKYGLAKASDSDLAII